MNNFKDQLIFSLKLRKPCRIYPIQCFTHEASSYTILVHQSDSRLIVLGHQTSRGLRPGSKVCSEHMIDS